MKLALFSDIHGNDIAFEVAVTDAKGRGATEFIIAGDLVSDYPLASDVIKRAQALTPYVIKGNRDEYFIDYYSNRGSHWKAYKQFAGMLWSFDHLTDDDYAYISGLPDHLEIAIDGSLTVYVTHHVKEIDRFIDTIPQRVLVCGHVHKPIQAWYGDKLYVNSGSVGANISAGFNTEYVLLDCAGGELATQIIHVPYDGQALMATLEDPVLLDNKDAHDWFRLLSAMQSSGTNHISELFKTAEKLKAERGYECNHVPNEIWDEIIRMYEDARVL